MSPEVIAIIISAASVGLALFAGLAGMFAWFFKLFKSELGEAKTSMKELDGSLLGEMKHLGRV